MFKNVGNIVHRSKEHNVIFLILCSLLYIIMPIDAICQQFMLSKDLRFDNFYDKNNIKDDYTGVVVHARNGYLWVGEKGILRTDGKQYIHYNNFNNKHHILRSNYVPYLIEDADGRIWAGTGGGLCYYNEHLDEFEYIDLDSSHKIEYAYALCMLGNNLWFKCNMGLCYINLKTLKVKTTSLKFNTGAIVSYALDSNTILVSENSGSYYIYHIGEDKYENRFLGKYKGIQIFSVAKIKNKILLGTQRGLWETDDFNQEATPLNGFEKCLISDIQLVPALTGDSILWLGTEMNGLILYNLNKRKVVFNYVHDPNNPFSIAGNDITNIFVDDNNMVWVSAENGISLVNFANQTFKEHIFFDKQIYNITKDKYNKNIVWICAYNDGIYKIDWITKEIIQHVFIPRNVITMKDKNSTIRDMWQIDKNKWALLATYGIIIWDCKKGVLKIINDFPVAENIFMLCLRNIIPYNKDSFYITTNNGLYLYHVPSQKTDTVILRHDEADPSSADIINGAADNSGNLWVATSHGLLKYNIKKRISELYKFDSGSPYENYMFDAKPDGSGRIICATMVGLAILDTTSKKMIFYPEFNKYKYPACQSVYITDTIAWVNSNAGIINYNISTNKSYVIDYVASAPTICKVNDELVVALHNKYMYFNPMILSQKQIPSPPVIEKIIVNDSSYFFPGSQSMILKPEKNTLEFYFTAFYYYNPLGLVFRYKLSGVDNNWNYTENQEYANYSHIAPGTYTFMVQSGNKNGEWNQNIVSFHFEITPPYWQTWWFRLSVVAGFIGLVVGIAVVRIKSIRKLETQKTAVNKEIAEMELKALRSQMNPHFIFNSLNSIQKFIWENKQEDAAEYLTKFSRLIRMILENSMQKRISLEQELSALSLYLELEHRRCNNKFDYLIDVDNRLDTKTILLPPLILQPYVENAIWHGLVHKNGRGRLTITIAKNENAMIQCIIEDNGIGRKASEKMKENSIKQSVSYGTTITRRRLELFFENEKQGEETIDDLYDENNIAKGTRVTINIPISSFVKI